MTCGDIGWIIDLESAMKEDPEVRDHLRTCDDCNVDLLIARAARQAFHPDIEVPTHLSEHVLDVITGGERAREEVDRPVDMWVTAVLGGTLTLATIFATGGSTEPGVTLVELALFSAAAGAVAAWAQHRARHRDAAFAPRTS